MKVLTQITTFVAGDPKAQGSLTPFITKPKNKKLQPKVVMTQASKGLPGWRKAIVEELARYMSEVAKVGGVWKVEKRPYQLDVDFIMPRPKSHPRVERLCKWRYQTPDLDKLVRAVCDALEIAGVLDDDARIAVINASKMYEAEGQRTGAQIRLSLLPVPQEWQERMRQRMGKVN